MKNQQQQKKTSNQKHYETNKWKYTNKTMKWINTSIKTKKDTKNSSTTSKQTIWIKWKNRTCCAPDDELPQSHCGNNRESTLLSWLHRLYDTYIYIIYIIYIHIHINIYTYIYT